MSNEAIREREMKATKGPWGSLHAVSFWVVGNNGEVCNYRISPEDADFVIHARQDIPDLLAQVDERDKRIEELEAEVKKLKGGDSRQQKRSQHDWCATASCAICNERWRREQES